MSLSRAAIVGLALYGVFLAAGILGLGHRPGGNPLLIRIVSSLPRTGSARTQTDAIVNGIRMALEDAEYKVGDFQIEYLDWDDATAAAGQWTAEAEAANADAAAKDPDVMVYIGPYNSGAAKVSIPILNVADMLIISPACTAPGLSKPGLGEFGEPEIYQPTGKVNFTRVVPADDMQGARAADWAKTMGAQKVYILDDTEVYGRGIAQVFNRRAQEIGLTVLGHESIDIKANEFKSLLTSIESLGPDLLYFGGTTQSKGGQIAKEMIDVGMRDVEFMGPDGCYETPFIESAGAENLIGRAYVTFGGLPPEQTPEFTQRYMKRWNTDQAPEGYAVYGYESARVALEAIKAAGVKNRAAITTAALGLKSFNGALGGGSFDQNGDIKVDVISGFKVVSNMVKDKDSGEEVERGKFEFQERLVKPE